MQVTVLYFAALRERRGQESEVFTLPEGSTLSALAREIELVPQLSGVLQSVRFAVNEEFAAADTALNEDDVVALIPPVQGG